jgi:creatinine amidohydrolase/Fe(II)-dependent formamide hydrolase-like protein
VRATILDPAVSWPWTTDEKAIADMGIIGDAKSASAEFGKQLLEKITDAAGGVFKQLLERQQFSRG